MRAQNTSKTTNNFSFLATHNPELVKIGTLSEQLLEEYPVNCLINLRLYGELLAKQVAANVGIYKSNEEDHYSLLKRLENQGLLQEATSKLFHQLRKKGNDAYHEGKGDYETALNCLKYAFHPMSCN